MTDLKKAALIVELGELESVVAPIATPNLEGAAARYNVEMAHLYLASSRYAMARRHIANVVSILSRMPRPND